MTDYQLPYRTFELLKSVFVEENMLVVNFQDIRIFLILCTVILFIYLYKA